MGDFLNGFKVPAKLFWDSSYERILETQRTLTDLSIQNWLHYSLTRWTWWLLLFFTVFPLFLWWQYIDKRSFLEISFFGLMTSIISGLVDSLGVQLLFWTYPNSLLPALPNYFPIDYVAIPVIFMLIYQKYPGWKGFIWASVLISCLLSLIGDPLLVWLNVYQPLSWQYYYSIPAFILIVSFAKFVTVIVVNQDSHYRYR